MKKKILFILTCLLLCGCGYDEYEVPEEVVIKPNENKYQIFSEINFNDLFQSENIEILNKDEKLINDEIGEHKVTLKYKYEKRKYKYDLTYTLYDDIAPFILRYSPLKTIEVNDDVYPCEDIVFIDNYDKEPVCEIEGEYDTTRVGVYNVTYILKDHSDNQVKKDGKINVVNHIKTNDSKPNNQSTIKLDFNDALSRYKNDSTMLGIDVSRWQGDIDYEEVKNAGVEFVIMRIGVQSGASKDVEMDSFYLKNIEKAASAGLKVGVYLYSTAINEDKAREHAKWVVKTLNGEKLDFPIAYDWENWQYLMEYKMSIHDMNKCFYAFSDELKKNGYDSMLYSSKYYLENIWDENPDYPVWLAHYTTNTDYNKKYILWQFASNGRVPGINANVDLDVYYK